MISEIFIVDFPENCEVNKEIQKEFIKLSLDKEIGEENAT